MEENKHIPEIAIQHPDYPGQIAGLLRSALTPKRMREGILDYHENDIAAALELLEKEEQAKLFSLLDAPTLAGILEYSQQPQLHIRQLSIRKQVSVLSHLEPATASAYLQQLEKPDRNLLMELMEEDVRREIILLSSFDEDEIGRKMTTH